MDLSEVFQTVLESLKSNKLRSGLTILGIIVGVAVAITMISMVEINAKYVLSQLSTSSAKVIDCRYELSKRRVTTSKLITLADIDIVRKRCYFVSKIAPLTEKYMAVKYELNEDSFNILGTTQEIQDIIVAKVKKGRFFVDNDFRRSSAVCILGNEVKEKLFGKIVPVGKDIILKFGNKKVRFQVIGFLEEEKSWAFWRINNSIIIPYTTMRSRITGKTDFDQFWAQADSLQTVEYAEAQITKLMESRDVPIRTWTPKESLEMNMEMRDKLSIFGFFISGLSLLIGGIGIMNIMLISVMERIREIGIRRAVGASEKDIMRQFLTESVFFGLVGGLIGVPPGIAGALIFGIFFKVTEDFPLISIISIPSIFIAFFFAAAVSIVFGYFPAQKAAKLDPVEALRYQ